MTKKSYKDWNVGLGCSDIAVLTVRDPMGLHEIFMDEDGKYTAHIVTNWMNYEIPKHYAPHISLRDWMWVYDDEGCVLRIENAERIDIYRAGHRGILINIIGENPEVEEE